jgi:hypothetical protein
MCYQSFVCYYQAKPGHSYSAVLIFEALCPVCSISDENFLQIYKVP